MCIRDSLSVRSSAADFKCNHRNDRQFHRAYGRRGAGHAHDQLCLLYTSNSRGDLFFDDAPYSYPDAAYVIEIPADGGPQVTLLSNVGYGASGVYVDSGDNLWAVDPNGNLIYVPFVGGAYASATNSSSLTACTMPLSSNTAPCRYFWQLNASIEMCIRDRG